MTVVYALKDGQLLVASTKAQAREAFDLGALPLFKAQDDEEAACRLKGRVTIVGASMYLTELLDRPFADVDELIGIAKTFSG